VDQGLLEGVVTWAEIELDAVADNLRALQCHVGQAVEIIAVVKANAYGHGAVPVARVALESGAARLAVHRATEGVELRQAGIQAPILVMGYTPPDGARLVVDYNLTPSLITIEFAQALSAYASATGITLPVHVKVDSGMGRYGLMPGEVLDFLSALEQLPGVSLQGLFTHFATADWADQTYVRQQLRLFKQMVRDVRQAGFEVPLVHAANSAATLYLPEAYFNAVRPGLALYGMHPSDERSPVFDLKPALTLKSTVSRVRDLPTGTGVSYGRTYVTQKPTLAALIQVGYGDGYHRALSNRGAVLIRGQPAPIIGRICMDQFVVDVSSIPGVRQDDEVVIIGRQAQAAISAEQVAAWAGTINYDVTTALLPRVVRVYLRGNQVVQVSP